MAEDTTTSPISIAAVNETNSLDQLEGRKAGKAFFSVILQASWSEGRASSVGSEVVPVRAEDASKGVGLSTVGDFGRSEDAVAVD